MKRKIRKFSVLAVVMVIGLLAPLHSEALPPDIQIARFKNDVSGAISLTFDDALPTHIENAIPILNEYGLRGTFFIHTDQVKEGTASNWEKWRKAAEDGHELGSHSMTHLAMPLVKDVQVLQHEIKGSQRLIEQNTDTKVISFAYPFSEENDLVKRLVLETYAFDRSDCRVWGGPDFKVENGVEHINQIVQNKNFDYVMLHGVGEPTWYSIDVDIFRKLVAYLAQQSDKIWTDTYANIKTYERKRNAVVIRRRNVVDKHFDFRLSLPDRPEFQNLPEIPLTVKIAVDGRNSRHPKGAVNGERLPLQISPDGEYILVDVIPDGRWVTIHW